MEWQVRKNDGAGKFQPLLHAALQSASSLGLRNFWLRSCARTRLSIRSQLAIALTSLSAACLVWTTVELYKLNACQNQSGIFAPRSPAMPMVETSRMSSWRMKAQGREEGGPHTSTTEQRSLISISEWSNTGRRLEGGMRQRSRDSDNDHDASWHWRTIKKLDLSPFTGILKKYNVTPDVRSHNFSKCFGPYADVMEDLLPRLAHTHQPLDMSQSQQEKGCRRILLIVFLNRPFYSSIKFLRRIYAPVFGDQIRFVADDNHPSHPGVFRTKLGFDMKSGFYQHLALSEVMSQWPDYHGYLFVGDDMAVNPYRMMEVLDPDKLWTTEYSFMSSIVNSTKETLPWYHWYEEWGLQSLVEALPCLPRDTFDRWQRGYVMKCKHCMVIHASDIGYVPRRFADNFRHWAYLLRETMNEIAFPNIVFAAADHKSDVQILRGMYTWDAQRSHIASYLKDDANVFVHPTKFSNASLQAYVEDWLKAKVKKYTRKAWTIC